MSLFSVFASFVVFSPVFLLFGFAFLPPPPPPSSGLSLEFPPLLAWFFFLILFPLLLLYSLIVTPRGFQLATRSRPQHMVSGGSLGCVYIHIHIRIFMIRMPLECGKGRLTLLAGTTGPLRQPEFQAFLGECPCLFVKGYHLP